MNRVVDIAGYYASLTYIRASAFRVIRYVHDIAMYKCPITNFAIRHDAIQEFNVDWKAERGRLIQHTYVA